MDLAHPTPEALLADLAWLRRLAQRLVHDPEVDDLVQEACARTLTRRDRWPRRGLLRAALVNLAREGFRASSRRQRRERIAARAVALDATADVAARYELQRLVVLAVGQLEEPFRGAILLRFFADLPPRAIAQRLGIPVKTVKSRLERGLARLRTRLDQLHRGGRPGWLAILAGLPVTAPVSLSVPGILAMKTKTLAIGGGLLVALSAVLFAVDARLDPRAEAPSAPARTEASRAAAPSVALPARAETAEVAAPTSLDPSAGGGADAPRHDRVVRGIVVDADGAPVAHSRLGFDAHWPARAPAAPHDGAPAVTSGADGRFALDVGRAASGDRIVCVDGSRFTLMSPLASDRGQDEVVVVVTPRLRLGGHVVDDAGVPLPKAEVRCALPAGLRDRLAISTQGSLLAELPAARTSGDGRFSCELPSVGGIALCFAKEGFVAVTQPAPAHDDPGLFVVLQRAEPCALQVSGTVLDENGRPVANARVALGGRHVRTSDDDGRFRFALPDALHADRIVAAVPGYLPVEARGTPLGAGRFAWPDEVELRLGARACAIGGTVVDARGAPIPGALVWLAQYGTLARRDDGFRVLIEGTLSGSRALWPKVAADDRGRFELGGLQPHDYALHALDPRSLVLATSAPIRAPAADITLEASGPAFEALRGRVVDRHGAGLAGITVRPGRLTFENAGFEEYAWGATRTTDADGAFIVDRVARADAFLLVTEDGIFPRRVIPAPDADGALPPIEVLRRCRVRLELGDAAPAADTVAAVDAHGEAVESELHSGNAVARRAEHRVDASRLNLVVPETAAAIVLRRDGQDVRRIPIQPRTDGPTLVR